MGWWLALWYLLTSGKSSEPAAPVEVVNAEPLPVQVVGHPGGTIQQGAKIDADILRTEDQRRISGIWERTQQAIALSIVVTTEAVIILSVVRDSGNSGTALTVLFGLANLVIGFYFGRTNHQRVGGVGSDEVIGR